MTIEQVLEMLDSAMRSEQEFVEEDLRRRQLFRAAESQARFNALAAFRGAILTRLSLEKREEPEKS